jgi:hypothetical protein
MSATTIFFNGRLISVPGSYTSVDASGLESVGLGASGIVALLGTSEGGIPWNAVEEGDVKGTGNTFTKPQQAADAFRSGDLLEAAAFAFGPSNDPDIPGGAQEVLGMKVNPAIQSTGSYANSDGDALDLTSVGYGYFTRQISIEIGTGTNQGKLVTITLEDIEETLDDLGGDTIFQLSYLSGTPADGFTTVTGAVTVSGGVATAVLAAFTRAQTGLDADITNQVSGPPAAVEIVSSSGSDVDQIVEIIGTDATNAAQRVRVTVAGLTAVITSETWNAVHGARIVSGSATVGTITLRNSPGGTAILTLTTGVPTKGLEPTVDHAVAGSAVTVVAGGASVQFVTLVGLSSTGTVQVETLQLAGTTPVPGVALWRRLDYLALGGLLAATTVTVSGNAVNAPATGINTLQKLADLFNGTAGFTLTLGTGQTTRLVSSLDQQLAQDIKSPANPTFGADLALIVEGINSGSQLVTALRGTPGTGAPDNTAAATFLTGGHEGSATPGQEAVPTALTADWTGAIDLLTKALVNTVVVVSGDPAIHALVDAHCAYMAGIGRDERDAVLGAQNAALDDVPTKTEYKAQVVDLNSRHVRLVGQAVERFNTNLEREEFQPPFQAVIVAGMQAGSAVGTPLTHKYANVLKLRQDTSWNPVDDAEEMIKAGCCFMEQIDNQGRRVVRNVTTHLITSNISFTEASVNEAVNFSVKNFRNEMEDLVGQTGFFGSVASAKGLATNILGLLVGVSLTAYRSLDIDLILDTLEVSVEISPVLPINFIKSTLHLVSIPQSAAAS